MTSKESMLCSLPGTTCIIGLFVLSAIFHTFLRVFVILFSFLQVIGLVCILVGGSLYVMHKYSKGKLQGVSFTSCIVITIIKSTSCIHLTCFLYMCCTCVFPYFVIMAS